MSLYIGNQKVTGIQKVGTDLPDQTGNAGKFLTTDGTNPSWAEVDALPSQTGQSGKYLTTDGTDASWAEVEAGANQDINNLTTLGNARLQYAPFAINTGTIINGNNHTLQSGSFIKSYTEAGTYTIEITEAGNYEIEMYGAGGGWARGSYTVYGGSKDYTIATGGSGAGFKGVLNLPIGIYSVTVGAHGVFVNGGRGTTGGNTNFNDIISANGATGGYSINGGYAEDIKEQGRGGSLQIIDSSYIVSTSKQMNGRDGSYDTLHEAYPYMAGATSVYDDTITGYGAGGGSSHDAVDGYFKITKLTGDASKIFCDPCTITTCDGRTKILDTATSIDISNQADGSYSIFKDYETGNLSLVDELVIGKINTVPWTQPVLSSNGTIGGSSFAVYSAQEYAAYQPLWKGFDNSTSDVGSIRFTTGSTGEVIIYNPVGLNISNINFTTTSANGASGATGTVYVSNDNTTWTEITSFSQATASNNWSIPLSYNGYYKYLKLSVTSTSYTDSGYYSWYIGNTILTATTFNDVWHDTSTTPANLKIYNFVNDEWDINNDLVYIGDCTIASGLVTALTNREFNDSGYLVQKSAMSVPDFINRIDVGTTLNSTVTYTAPCKGYISVNIWSYGASCTLKINNVLLYQTQGSGNLYTPAVTTFVPVQKNDYIEAYSGYPNTSYTDQKVYFYPMRGE